MKEEKSNPRRYLRVARVAKSEQAGRSDRVISHLRSHVGVRMFATDRQAVLHVHVGFQPGLSLVSATVVLQTTQRLTQVETGVVSTQRTSSSPSPTETVRHRL